GRGLLFLLPDRDKLGVLLLWVLSALRAICDDHVGDFRPVLDQLRDRAARAEVRIVRVRGDDEHIVELLRTLPGCHVSECKRSRQRPIHLPTLRGGRRGAGWGVALAPYAGRRTERRKRYRAFDGLPQELELLRGEAGAGRDHAPSI